jgi:hypothetical protein
MLTALPLFSIIVTGKNEKRKQYSDLTLYMRMGDADIQPAGRGFACGSGRQALLRVPV